MKTYEIHELALQIPSMMEDEYIELQEDIKNNGLLSSITLYQEKILDGRHRYKVCQELGIEAEFDYYNGDTPASFVLSKNIFRRSLTASQKAAVATDMLPFYEKEAQHGGDRKSDEFQEGNISTLKGKSRDKLGETIGVSGRYISDAKRLKRENPEMFEKVKSGEVSLHRAQDVRRISAGTNNVWHTPRKYIEAARGVLGEFDIDPASNEDANRIVGAKIFFSEETNGLQHDWPGRVWLNPPYGGIASDFVTKLVSQFEKSITTEAILLVNANSTDTKWFAPLWNHLLCFTNHRIDFSSPDNLGINSSTHGSVFIYFGKQKEKFIECFKQFGPIVERVDV